MAIRLSHLKSLLLACCAASALMAQVDTKLLTTTDVLDVYKNGGSTPEMLTIFDTSGSMANAFWHAKYWTDLNSDTGVPVQIDQLTGVVTIDIGPMNATGYLVEPSGARITTLPITAAVVKRASHARLTATKTSGTKTYTRTLDIPIPWTIFQVPSTLPTLPSAGTAPVSDYMIDPKSSSLVEFDTVYKVDDSHVVWGLGTVTAKTITAASWNSNVATFTCANHGLAVGDDVVITGVVPSGYNGTFVVTTVPTSGTFKVALSPSPGSYSSGGTMNRGGSGGQIAYHQSSGDFLEYNQDYIYWLFWGNVVKALDGNSYVATAASGGFTDDRNQAPPGGGIFTTSTSGLGGSYPAGGGYIIPGVYDNSGSASTPSTTVWSDNRGTTFNNGIPAGTRVQFLKKAVLETWFSKQDKVLWAYRFLDPANEPGSNLNSANFDSSDTYRNLTRLKTVTTGIDPSVSFIQGKVPQNGTPLSYALANAYAQLVQSGTNTTPGSNSGSVFDKVNTGVDPSPCRASTVVLFTDGLGNDSSGSSYLFGKNEVAANATTAVLSEADLQALSYSALNPVSTSSSSGANSNFNIWSLAAVAAHGLNNGTNNTSQKTTGTGTPSQYAPFRVMSRGADGTTGRKIQTMTVGLSLAGTNTSSLTTGGKGPLLRTALYGDPSNTNVTGHPDAKFDLANSVAYGKTPTASTGTATYFFDAADPQTLSDSLSAIIARVTAANTSITAPAAPLVGLNLGNRAYLGRFQSTNKSNSSVWMGDLLMAGIGIQSDGTVGLKDITGAFQVDINADNAVASASKVLLAKGWKGRNVYTMVPGTGIPGGGLDLTAADQAFSDANSKLTAKVMGTATLADAQSLIRFIRGAGTPASSSDTTSRLDIMGDIVNSSPAAVEFDPTLIPAGSPLKGLWTSKYSSMKDARFQLIFVGDNQGHFHAFGEVSALTSAGVLEANLDELWSFIPPELLNTPSVATVVPKLSVLQTAGNDHIYTTDGSPYIYFKDTPLTGTSIGNRLVDSSDTIRVIFGMRKGGRSYYALDVINPGSPKLAWMIDPNNASDSAIKTMGLATATPAVARVDTGYPATTQDVVFLGGGYSNNALDGQTIGNNSGAVKLGRSMLAVSVLDGTLIKSYDFVNNGTLAASFPNMGAISAGVFPLEFFVGSKKAQRVYFGDMSGGVYALGSMETLTTAPVGWRLDNSNLDKWTTDGSLNVSTTPGNAGIRWIYKGKTTVSGGKVIAAAPVSGTPVAFRIPKAIPQFKRPASASNAANMIPPVVGVTFGTGDRNDPMDLDPVGTVGSESYRQVMILDRQDSADLPGTYTFSNVNGSSGAITDSQLSDQTATSVPGDTSYLGNSLLGYYLLFHPPVSDPVTLKLVAEKAYLNVLVVNGGLVFSTFKPVANGTGVICQGAGYTYTFRLCDALAPVFGSGNTAATGTTDKQQAGCNGYVFSWSNLAGDLASVGSRMVIQSGQDTPTAGNPTSPNVKVQDLVVTGGSQSFAPRAWRIIR